MRSTQCVSIYHDPKALLVAISPDFDFCLSVTGTVRYVGACGGRVNTWREAAGARRPEVAMMKR